MNNMNNDKEEIVHLLQGLKLEQDDSIKIKQYIDNNNYASAVNLLRNKRGGLLLKLHACQKAIDDLDLLVYQVKKLELGGQK